MRIYPAVHYTMGGLWVDYNLMSTVPGLFVLGEANFSDHGANRLGASALMQGLADGYFVLPYTIGNYLASHEAREGLDQITPTFRKPRSRSQRAHHEPLAVDQGQAHGRRSSTANSARSCGRTAAWPATRPGLRRRLANDSRARARSSGRMSTCPASATSSTSRLEHAGRVADFLEFAELMCLDALDRNESCGGHFREEYPDRRRAKRCATTRLLLTSPPGNTRGDGKPPVLHKEPLIFEDVHPSQRSYK